MKYKLDLISEPRGWAQLGCNRMHGRMRPKNERHLYKLRHCMGSSSQRWLQYSAGATKSSSFLVSMQVWRAPLPC